MSGERGAFWNGLRRAVGYVRVSKARDEMISPEIQREAIGAYAERNGFVIVKWLEDLNKSGRTFEKRAVKAIVDAIAAGEYEAVILWKWSRWGRNASTSAMYVSEVEHNGGKVYAATEDIDTSTAIGRFQRGFMFQLAELESDQKGEQWKETHGVRRSNGLPHTTNNRFGYTYAKDTGYVVNESEADMLAEAYRRFNAGESMRSIVADVNARGFRSTQKTRDKDGNSAVRHNLFTPTSWGRLMDTGFAAGLIRERSGEKLAELKREAERAGKAVADTAKSTLKDFDVWRQGAHVPVIDMPTWETYKAMRLENAAKAPARRRAKHTFSGMVVCELCETPAVSQVSEKHNKHNWRCRSVLESKTKCKGITISNRKVEAAVLAWVQSEVEGLDSVDGKAERIAAARAAADEVASLKVELGKLDKREANLKDMREYGEVTRDEYRKRFSVIEGERDRLAGLLRAAERRATAGGADMRPAFTTIRETWADATPEERRMMLLPVLRVVRVAPGGLITPVPAWEGA